MASVLRKELQASAALTTTTTASSQSLEAMSDKFVGWLKITACHAATTVTCVVQHSADNSNFVDVISFTPVVGTTGVQAVQCTSGLLPYVRAKSTLAGATQAATLEISLYYDRTK